MATEAGMDENALAADVYKSAIDIMMQGSNGGDVFSNERALYGYVEAHEYLALPAAFADSANAIVSVDGVDKGIPNITLKEFGGLKHIKAKLGTAGNTYKDATSYRYTDENLVFTKIAMMNYKMLKDGGIKSDAAHVVASLRARWCILGAYHVRKTDTRLPYDETAIYGLAADRPDTGWVDDLDRMAVATTIAELLRVDIVSSREYMGFVTSSDFSAKWITGIAETLWAAEEFIVRVRGHHYKKEYEVNLLKFVSACFEGTDKIPKNTDMAVLFRTSLHAFGLKALPVMTAHWAIWGKLGSAAIIRFSAAPNGMAVVTTTAAAIKAMATEPWYGKFEVVYKKQLTLLYAFEKAILSNKFGFHQSSVIYGENSVTEFEHEGKTYTIEEIKEVGANMAAIGQGFIEAMRIAIDNGMISSFSFSNAKAMEKHAANAPLTTLRIKSLVTYAIDAVADAENVNDAIAAAIPDTKKALIEAGSISEVN